MAARSHQQVGVGLAANRYACQDFDLADRPVEQLEAAQAISITLAPDCVDYMAHPNIVRDPLCPFLLGQRRKIALKTRGEIDKELCVVRDSSHHLAADECTKCSTVL